MAVGESDDDRLEAAARAAYQQAGFISAVGRIQAVRKFQWVNGPDFPEKATVISWRHRYLGTSRIYIGSETRRFGAEVYGKNSDLPSEDEFDKLFAHNLQDVWRKYNADILQQIRKAQGDGLASILEAVLASGRRPKPDVEEVESDIAYRRLSAFLRRQGSPGLLGSQSEFEAWYDKNVQLRSVVADINAVEVNVEQALAPRDQLQALITRMFSGNKRILFEDRSISVQTDNGSIDLSTLASGEKQILYIFVTA